MAEDKPLKSAYELAMDRLRAEDSERGVKAASPLSDGQKREIGELRNKAKAKHAEVEILHRKEMAAAAADPEQLTKLEEQYDTDRRRIDADLEEAVARVRGEA